MYVSYRFVKIKIHVYFKSITFVQPGQEEILFSVYHIDGETKKKPAKYLPYVNVLSAWKHTQRNRHRKCYLLLFPV